MARGESVVVVKHGPLQLKVLLQKRYMLDLAWLVLQTLTVGGERWDLLDIPDVAGLLNVLVAVDLCLLVSPVGEGSSMGPHGDSGREMNELEVRRHGLEVLTRLATVDFDLEESFVEAVSVGILKWDGGELLVGWVVWGRNVVGEKPGVSDQVAKADDVAVLDVMTRLLWKWLGRNDLPHVVGVIMRVSSDLLSLTRDSPVIVAQRVPVSVAVEVHLGFLVLDGDGVVVINGNRLLCHDVVAESLLEFRAHKVIARSRPRKNGKVDLEPEKVEQERNNDQTNNSGRKMLSEIGQGQGALPPVDVEQIPQINSYRNTDGEEGEGANVFGRDDAAQADTSQEQPLPPLAAERVMAKLVEANVAEDRESHEQNKGCIEQDQSRLANVRIVEENEACSENTCWQRVSGFPHDPEDSRHGKRTHHGGH